MRTLLLFFIIFYLNSSICWKLWQREVTELSHLQETSEKHLVTFQFVPENVEFVTTEFVSLQLNEVKLCLTLQSKKQFIQLWS